MPMSDKLIYTLENVRRVDLEPFCTAAKNLRFPSFTYAKRHECSVSQIEFLKLLAYFTVDKLNLKSSRAKTLTVPNHLRSFYRELIQWDLSKLTKTWQSFHAAIYRYLVPGIEKLLHEKTDVSGKVQQARERYQAQIDLIGQVILNNYGHLLVPPPGSSGNYMCEKLTSLIPDELKENPSDVVFKYAGGGAFGQVVFMKDSRAPLIYVAKFVKNVSPATIEREINAQGIFYQLGIAPAPIEFKSVRHGSVNLNAILMEPVDYTLKEALCHAGSNIAAVQAIAEDVYNVLTIMRDSNVTHGDLHLENFCYVYPKTGKGAARPVLIDFGMSSTNYHLPEVDVEQLVRTLIDVGVPYKYADVIVNRVNDFLKDSNCPYTIVGTTKQHRKVWDYYIKKQRAGFEEFVPRCKPAGAQPPQQTGSGENLASPFLQSPPPTPSLVFPEGFSPRVHTPESYSLPHTPEWPFPSDVGQPTLHASPSWPSSESEMSPVFRRKRRRFLPESDDSESESLGHKSKPILLDSDSDSVIDLTGGYSRCHGVVC